MTTAYWCVLIAALLPYVATLAAKIGGEKFDNRDPREWLNRAQSNLARARDPLPGTYLEDFCFDAQQAAEKAIKAVFIAHGLTFPYIHDLGRLLTLLAQTCAFAQVPRACDAAFPLALYVYLQEKTIPRVYRNCDFQVLSDSTRDDLMRRGIPDPRIHVVRSGIDHSYYVPPPGGRGSWTLIHCPCAPHHRQKFSSLCRSPARLR